MIDPFTIALATFGIQKLRGKSTRMALKDAALMGGGAYGLSAFAPGAASSIGIGGSPLSGIGFGTGTATTTGASASVLNPAGQSAVFKGATTATPGVSMAKTTPSLFARAGEGIKGLIGTSKDPTAYKAAIESGMPVAEAKKLYGGSGFMGLDTGAKLGIGLGASTLLAGEEEQPEPPFTEADYEKASAEQKAKMKGAFERATYQQQTPQASPYNYGDTGMYTFNTGGIVNLETIPKYNQGGINYLPSKIDHDENDSNNYVRAQGYVEDGSGNGDKDEDTILAQLADGEFVSRADAILGAGIIEGADPKNYKDMRRKGAAFFYDQQSKFKRVFDMIDASRAKSSKAN